MWAISFMQIIRCMVVVSIVYSLWIYISFSLFQYVLRFQNSCCFHPAWIIVCARNKYFNKLHLSYFSFFEISRSCSEIIRCCIVTALHELRLLYNSKQSGTQTWYNSGASTNNERPNINSKLQYSVWLEEDSNSWRFWTFTY